MNIWHFNLKCIFSLEQITLRRYTILILYLMLTQYIPIESRAGVSWVKVAMMTITPFVLIRYLKITKAFVCAFLYMSWIFLTAYVMHPWNFRASTVIYLYMYVITYVAFYNFVWVQKVFTLDYFIKLVRNLMYLLTIVLIIQQVFIIIGVKYFPLINLSQILNRGIGANSLTFEPSTFARVMGVLFYAYLKCNEYRTGVKLTLLSLFSSGHRWVTIALLWSMLTMGSGTAFICLGVLSLYFMRGFQFLYAIPIFVAVYLTLDFLEVKQFNRAVTAAQATMTGDAKEVAEADGSAYARIAPVLNTLEMDFTELKSWVGEGCDTGLLYHRTANRYMGEINDYGLIAYIIGLIFVFCCAIKPFSLATLMYFMGIGGGTGNISYAWGLLMLITCVKYFTEIKSGEQCKTE